jgi:hypothetical protein
MIEGKILKYIASVYEDSIMNEQKDLNNRDGRERVIGV